MSRKVIKRGRLFAAFVSLACMMGLFAPAAFAQAAFAQAAFAAGPEEIVLTVKQAFASDGTPPGETFSYRLAPKEQGNPMPPGSGADGYVFAVTGTGNASICLAAFSQAGVYTYELSHTTGIKPGYIYDQETYTLEILVNSDLTTAVVATKKDGCKAEEIHYSHSYSSGQEQLPGDSGTPGPGTPGPGTPAAGTPGPGNPSPADSYAAGGKPKTGDEFPAWLYTALICLAGAVMLGSAVFLLVRNRRRRRQGGQ